MSLIDHSTFSFDEMARCVKEEKAINCYVMGQSGSGKTTLLKHILYELKERGVVFVPMAFFMLTTASANLFDVVPRKQCIKLRQGDLADNKKQISEFLTKYDESMTGLEDSGQLFLIITDDLTGNNKAFEHFMHTSRHLNTSCIFLLHDITDISKQMRSAPNTFLFITSLVNVANRVAHHDFPGLETVMTNTETKAFLEKKKSGNVVIITMNMSKTGVFTLNYVPDNDRESPVYHTDSFEKYVFSKQLLEFVDRSENQ